MDPITAFLVVLVLLLALAAGILLVVQRPLREILLELCGAPHRVRFWTRLFDSALLLTVLFFCLWSTPATSGERITLPEVASIVRTGLLGLLVALGVLAVLMLRWQARFERGLAPPPSRRGGTRSGPGPGDGGAGA